MRMHGLLYIDIPSTRMMAGVPSRLVSHFTVEPLFASCRFEMVISTGLSVKLLAEELRPAVSCKLLAMVSCFEMVELAMAISQNRASGELPLWLQVKVMSPPAGMTYPPGTRVPSADKVATTRSAGNERSGTI